MCVCVWTCSRGTWPGCFFVVVFTLLLLLLLLLLCAWMESLDKCHAGTNCPARWFFGAAFFSNDSISLHLPKTEIKSKLGCMVFLTYVVLLKTAQSVSFRLTAAAAFVSDENGSLSRCHKRSRADSSYHQSNNRRYLKVGGKRGECSMNNGFHWRGLLDTDKQTSRPAVIPKLFYCLTFLARFTSNFGIHTGPGRHTLLWRACWSY